MPVAVVLHAIIVARIVSLLYENNRSSTLSYCVKVEKDVLFFPLKILARLN
jgi:hypothetical protein